MTETEAWAAQLPPHEGSKSMVNIDTSTEAVERLLEDVTPGPWGQDGPVSAKIVWAGPDLRVCFLTSDGPASKNARFIAAARDLVPALLKERDEAVDAKLDALSTLDAWFDRRKLGNEAVNQAVIDAASGYLRTSRVGGMPQVESDLILGVMQDMSRLGLFADIFARAMNDLVPALMKDRDEARAQLAEVQAELVRRVDMHECAMAERDDATLYGDDQKARADRAEAALAALEPAPRVSETQKSEHDSADVLISMPAPVTLADALKVPEVRALVEALRTLLIAADGGSFADYLGALETAAAALRAIAAMKEG